MTVLVAQAFQSILSFQSLLAVAIPPVEKTPYPLDFFRYQIIISFASFAYLLVGMILFATLYCYTNVIRIEEQELALELKREKKNIRPTRAT